MARSALCFITVGLLAASARAQPFPADGAETPAQSFSLQDDATAIQGNPGGLGFLAGFEADFLHNGFPVAQASGHSEALLLATGFGPFTIGFGEDWLRRSYPGVSALSYRRTSLSLGVRMGMLGLGATWRTRTGPFGYDSWDFGAMLRPTRWISIGAAALNADRPSMPGSPDGVPRQWALSLGARPSGSDSLEAAVDLRWSQCATPAFCGFDQRDLFFTMSKQLVDGVRLLGQFQLLRANKEAETKAGLVGLQFDLAHMGVTYAPRWEENATEQSEWRIRLSSERWPSVHLPIARAAVIDLDKALEREKPSALGLIFGQTRRDPLAQLTARLHRLAGDRSVKAVVFRTGGMPVGFGKAQELGEAIQELHAKGKKVVFYLESAEDLEYSLASTADRIYAAPQAVLLVNGFSSTALFAGAGLEKLGVKAEFFRVGAYKNAPDLFTRSSMSGEQFEVQSSLLDDMYGRYVKEVAQARHLDEGKLKGLLDKGILKTSEAVEAGLVDGLIYPDQLEGEVGKLLGGKVSLEKTAVEAEPVRETRWGPHKKIAVVRVEGDILRGEGTRDPFGVVEIAGSNPIVRRIRRAAADPEVAAIVVRIDSPGGDGNASDLIWRELVRARKEKKKPVIASMGDVAASGGYYVAAGADEIWAEPSTITGSIGVFVGHFDGEELFGKLGLNLTTVKRGRSADLFSPARDLNDTERKTLQSWVDSFYEQFLGRVGESRGLSRDQVDAVARGRVWTGAQALDKKLIDHLGGLDDAIGSAKKWADLDAEADVDDVIESKVEVTDFASAGVLNALPAGMGTRALKALQLLGEPGTVRAALPFDLEVR